MTFVECTIDHLRMQRRCCSTHRKENGSPEHSTLPKNANNCSLLAGSPFYSLRLARIKHRMEKKKNCAPQTQRHNAFRHEFDHLHLHPLRPKGVEVVLGGDRAIRLRYQTPEGAGCGFERIQCTYCKPADLRNDPMPGGVVRVGVMGWWSRILINFDYCCCATS